MKRICFFTFILLTLFLIQFTGCSPESGTDNMPDESGTDITDAIFTKTSSGCSDYIEEYFSMVSDIKRNVNFEGEVEITSSSNGCTISVNGIPNHDFNDASASFATDVQEVERTFNIPSSPSLAAQSTVLSQQYYDAIMLNGVVVDILSAGCYKPNDPQAGADGNVQIGCTTNDGWLLDPLGTESKFGADSHNAHTQPDGTYHYHGDPNAMFDDNPGEKGSPVIGFAADGFPIFGNYFLDPQTNTVRKAISGYELLAGSRPGPDNNDPGGTYDGEYIDDYEFTGNGDLDECNGMIIDGQYGYYVTDTYPWMMACYSGTPDASFSKGGPAKVAVTTWHHSH
ncbi:MAG: YHYH protein [Balneolaceae bacterium]